LDAITLLREQSRTVSEIFSRVLAPITDEQLLWQPEGAKTNAIASTVLHVVGGEDRAIHGQAKKPTILQSSGLGERLGYDPQQPWVLPATVSADVLRAYASEVSAATAAYLETLQPEDLTREVPSPRGVRSLREMLTMILVVHKCTHMGEISALLGCQGVTGFPV